MKLLIVCIALLAPSLAFADGFGYQDSAPPPSDGFGYQTPPDWTPPPPPSSFGPLYDSDDN